MAAIGATLSGLSPMHRTGSISSSPSRFRASPILSSSTRRSAATSTNRVLSAAERTATASSSFLGNGRFQKKFDGDGEAATSMRTENPYANPEEAREECRKSLKDFFEEAEDLIGVEGGPPRWFSPLECGARVPDSPLLLFLPGFDGTGLGLIRHHTRLGKIFDTWCLHIPVKNRAPARELVKLVEKTVRSENQRSPNRPIYIVGESLGAYLALDVAARNRDIDLVLILANPVSSSASSVLQPLITLLSSMSDQLPIPTQHMLSPKTGDPLKMVMDIVVKGLPFQEIFGKLLEDVAAIPSYLSIMMSIFPKDTVLWKLRMLQSASASANSHLHAVRAQTLLLSSGSDQLLQSQEDAERIYHALPNCEIRRFDDKGQFLFLEDDFDLVTVIKGASFYRHGGKDHDYVSDYMLPTPSEFRKVYDSHRLILLASSPVMLSTPEDGKVVKGLEGIPSEGPALYVGYHMLLGLELAPLVLKVLMERNILLRGMAHPMMFVRRKDGNFPGLQSFDNYRLMGAVPVSASNFYKMLSANSHILLYPGGVREALHRKGEEYKLFWPEHSEFVRMAARFGAKIIPFGVVGEDDIGEVIFDYNDQIKIPYLKDFIQDLTNEVIRLRTDVKSEVGNQDLYLPGILPKLPGRFYYYFGKPIETAGRERELRDRDRAHELYLKVKSEVEHCIAYLKEKRETDPYRNLLPRLLYHARHGFSSQAPTFEL